MKRTNRAFTLMEMLVVMGIIVIALLMAVPTIKYLTGSNSEQAAQNAVTAMLARARTDAIGLQQPEGVLFVIDQATDRVMLYQVMQSVNPAGTDPTGVAYLDLVPDRDPLMLPPAIRAWTIKDTYLPAATSPGVSFIDPFPTYRYLGYNNVNSGTAAAPYTASATTDKSLIGGVILFDGQGNLLVTPYGFRYMNGPNVPTALAGLLFTSPTTASPAPPAVWPPGPAGSPPTMYLRSQQGLIFVDRETFQNQERQAGATGNLDGNPTNASGTSAEPTLDPWLDLNTTPMVINRYNGTLVRAE